MAPEQVESSATVDHRADIYAFGEIVYEMLTGERAWRGESVFAVVAARLTAPAPDARALVPGAEPRLAELALRCMARRPADRYASMEDVANALSAITNTSELQPPPPLPHGCGRTSGVPPTGA